MGKNLVIVESPAKARTINKILGREYLVKASMGHVRDLPEKKLGVDVNAGFRPHYVTIRGKQKVIGELKKAAADAERIYLAPDPDREGEAIAWHLKNILSKIVPEDQFYRVTYNEITADAIRRAFRDPGRIDTRRVDSQQARRILDRLVGYLVSPLLWRRIRGASSAGRVQSVALRLVCEREKEITGFVKTRFWIILGRFRKPGDETPTFEARLAKIAGEKADIRSEEDADAILQELRRRDFHVAGITRRELRRKPRPPYITSTLQQAASRFFGFAPARTMRIAQRLYEGVDLGSGPVGLITYMRTDSVNIADEARRACREFVASTYGPDYVPAKPNVFRSRGTAQEAHEAIRPTDVTRTPDSLADHLQPDELKLYRIVWERFVASQMSPARIAQQSVEIEAAVPADSPPPDDQSRPWARTPFIFRTSAAQVIFDGYMKVTGLPRHARNGAAEENGAPRPGEEDQAAVVDRLPELHEKEPLTCLECRKEEKETQPPPRYTEATLIRSLEENGVGRPSTYAQIISTLYDRHYVEREKRALKPTPLGMQVYRFLVEHLNELFEVKFTAQMEETLDEIERGRVQWTRMLEDFHRRLTAWLENARGPRADSARVERLLTALAAVKEWAPPRKGARGRKYDDRSFVESIREQFREDPSKISARQAEALATLAERYQDQIPDWDRLAAELGLHSTTEEERAATEQAIADARAKLDALTGVNFDAPRKVGRRTYDDAAFAASLRARIEQGKPLTERQSRYLDRLLTKYAAQLGGEQALAEKFNLTMNVVVNDAEIEELLQRLEKVSQWDQPVQRRGRKWDDKAFFESLRRQYQNRHALSDRQKASLRRLVKKYAARAGSESTPPPAESAPHSD